MKRTKEKRGITLIALIITIIVLLILAGVTISMVVGDNGVLKQAQNAKIKTEKAKDQELRGLTAAEAGGNLEMTWYQDGDNKVPIPAGFAVSQVEGENKVDEGLVVIDKNGNEFVWIPVNETKYNAYKNLDYEISNGIDWSNYQSGMSNKEWNNPQEQIKSAKSSIENYGGFYIARYEAGIPSNASFYIANTRGGNYIDANRIQGGSSKLDRGNNGVETIKNLIPVSKQGVQAWNYISQPNAKIVSEKMYKDNDTVDSYLIDSYAWNYICEEIFQNQCSIDIKNSKTYGNYLDNDSTNFKSLDCLWAKHYCNNGKWTFASEYNKGNITSNDLLNRNNGYVIELATGASDDFKIYNIYDMAGNMWEYTTETSNPDYCVRRGGNFNRKGNLEGESSGCVIFANGDLRTVHGGDASMGFRVVLYIK